MAQEFETRVKAKLAKLSNSRDSIQTIAEWILFHEAQKQSAIQAWSQSIQQVTQFDAKLAHLYVCNDVIQKSRSKSKDNVFGAEFKAVLVQSLSHVYKQAPDRHKNSIGRIVSIWRDRQIYDSAFIEDIKAGLGVSVLPEAKKKASTSSKASPARKRSLSSSSSGAAAAAAAASTAKRARHESKINSAAPAPATPSTSPPAPASSNTIQIDVQLLEDALFKALVDLHTANKTDIKIANQIAALSPIDEHTINDKEKARVARDTLTAYKLRLEKQLKRRRELIELLNKKVVDQEKYAQKIGPEWEMCCSVIEKLQPSSATSSASTLSSTPVSAPAQPSPFPSSSPPHPHPHHHNRPPGHTQNHSRTPPGRKDVRVHRNNTSPQAQPPYPHQQQQHQHPDRVRTPTHPRSHVHPRPHSHPHAHARTHARPSPSSRRHPHMHPQAQAYNERPPAPAARGQYSPHGARDQGRRRSHSGSKPRRG